MITKSRVAYLMTVPAVVLFFVFHTLPALQGVFYSFTDSRGYGSWEFVWFRNYIDLFQDPQVLGAYRFTLLFAVVSTVLANLISLAIAVGLTRLRAGRAFLRGIYFLPAVLSTIVISYIFNYIFANAMPALGKAAGIDALSTNILGNPQLAWLGIVFVAVWQGCAVTTVIYMAGLQTIPEDVIEAAEVDGASPWQRFSKITLPLIVGFVTINMVLSFKNFLMVFDQVVALTNGGPGTSTQSLSFLIYRNGFTGGEFGYQSANAVVYFIVIALLTLTQLRLLGGKGDK